MKLILIEFVSFKKYTTKKLCSQSSLCEHTLIVQILDLISKLKYSAKINIVKNEYINQIYQNCEYLSITNNDRLLSALV